LRSVRWADIPQLSTRDRRCPAAWLQSWLQSRRNGLDARPPVFRAGDSPGRLYHAAAGCQKDLESVDVLRTVCEVDRATAGCLPSAPKLAIRAAHNRPAMAAHPIDWGYFWIRRGFSERRDHMQQQQSWQSTVIGLGFLTFAGFALWVAADHNFSAIWAGVGTIVGS
jgi:hypothetical protein